MDDAGGTSSVKNKMKSKVQDDEEDSEEEVVDSEDDDETIARIQRAHFAQAAAMSARRRAAPRPRPMSHKRKMEAVKNFHDFTKKLKKDTGITIRSLVGNNILELSDFSSEDSKTESDGLSEEEFEVNLNAVQELNEENESYIDPETGDIVEAKKKPQSTSTPEESPPCPEPEVKQEQEEQPEPEQEQEPEPEPELEQEQEQDEEEEQPKTLSISDLIDEGDLENKNVEIAEVEESDLCPDKSAEELLDMKQEESSQDFDITEKLKEMGEISVKPIVKKEDESGESSKDGEKKPEDEDEVRYFFIVLLIYTV